MGVRRRRARRGRGLQVPLHHLVTAARNQVILRVIDVLVDLLRTSRERSLQVPGRLERSLEGHRRVVPAIRSLLGRWSTMLLRGVRHAVRVRVCAPLDLRVGSVSRTASGYRGPRPGPAQRYDQGVRARIRQFFDVEWEDSDLYDS